MLTSNSQEPRGRRGSSWSERVILLLLQGLTAAARGAPRHDQRSLSGGYDANVLERCSSESEGTIIDILERCNKYVAVREVQS